MFHALTGCDTASSFARHDEKTAWTIWTVLPEVTVSLLKLSSASSGIPDNAMHTVERFVVLLVALTEPAHGTTLKRHGRNLHKEEQCAADPNNQCSTGGAREESVLPRRPCVGSNTATNNRAASSIQLELGQE